MPRHPLPAPLPPLLGTVRRGRMLGSDGAVATWEGWDTERGVRVLVQTGLHARMRDEAGHGGLRWNRRDAPLPHLVSEPILGILAEREPFEPGEAGLPGKPGRAGEGVQLAVPIALAGVRDLCALHRAGIVHGGVSTRSFALVERGGRTRWTLGRWPGAPTDVRPGAGPEQDWRTLGTLVASLGEALDVETFAHWPPRDADEAWARVRASLPRELAAARHALYRRATRTAGTMARARLCALATRLGAAAPPPSCDARVDTSDGRRFTLRAGARRFEVDDGTRVRVVWTRDEGEDRLDVSAARALVRAVGRSGTGGSTTPLPTARTAMRWVVAALRLHTERVVLEGSP